MTEIGLMRDIALRTIAVSRTPGERKGAARLIRAAVARNRRSSQYYRSERALGPELPRDVCEAEPRPNRRIERKVGIGGPP